MPAPEQEAAQNQKFSYVTYAQHLARIQSMFPGQGVYGWIGVLNDYINNHREDAAGLTNEELCQLSDVELIRYTDQVVEYENKYICDVWNGFIFILKHMALLQAQLLQMWYDGDNATVAVDLTSGQKRRSATVIENLALWALAQDIRHSQTLRSLFDEHGERFYAAFENDREGQEWLAYMSVDESHDPASLEEAPNQRRKAAYADVLANIAQKPLGFAKAELFKVVYSYMEELLVLRDDHRDFVDICTFTYKRAFVEINRRLMERGVFDSERDFYFLGKEELYELFEGRRNLALLKAKIAARMKNFDQLDEKEVVLPIYLQHNHEIRFAAAGEEEDGTALRGVGTSSGTITGTARIVKTLKEIGRVQKGDILIVNATDPGWTPVFLLISGLILEGGGLLSHGASLSREYGIPALQLPDAMRRIPDGATITLDGVTGVVTIEEADGDVDGDAAPQDADGP